MKLNTRKKLSHKKHNLDFVSARQSVHKKRSFGLSSISNRISFGWFKPKDSKGPKTPQSKLKKILVRIAVISSLSFLFLLLVGIVVLIGVVSVYSKKIPNIEDLFKQADNYKETIIVDRNMKELYRLQGKVLRERLRIEEVPHQLKWAFLAAEDAEFESHKGLNLVGLTRAVSCNVTSRGRGVNCGGGSSITQQVVKNYTTQNAPTLERKIQEAVISMKIEQEYSKDQILEYYLNIVGEGGVLEGAKTGSKYLFGKEDMSKLTLAEMAYLAAIPNEPPVLSPWGGTLYNPEKSIARANYVLDRMLALKDKSKVTEEEIKKAKEELPYVTFLSKGINKNAPHFTDYVMQQLDKMYADKVEPGKLGRDYLKDKGYTIVTTVDLDTQELLQDTVRTQVKDSVFQKQIGAQNAAAVIMDPRNGEILAMVGSRNFDEPSSDPKFQPQDNAALRPRSLGSTFKPMMYLTAFMNGYNPSSILVDMPLDLKADGAGQSYYAQNYDRRYGGLGQFLTMRKALERSLNVPAVETYHLVGGQNYADTYIKLNGYEPFRKEVVGPAAPLGAANMPLLEQVHAYATLGAEGVYHDKKVILEIKDDQGQVIFDNRKVSGKQVIEKKYIFLVNDMNMKYWKCNKDLKESDDLLKKVGQSMDFACKTGTGDVAAGKAGDVAFVGYTPTFAMGVWAGNSCGATACPLEGQMPTGEEIYNHLYKPFFAKYIDKVEPARFTVPDGVKKVELCRETGRLKSADCQGGTVFEWTALPPKAEDMYEKHWVTDCEGTEKLARDIDKELGLATEKTYFVYKFPNKRIEAQIHANLEKQGKMPPKEECNVDRSVKKPEIALNSPAENAEFKPGDQLSISADITGTFKMQNVDFVLDSIIQQSFTDGPYQLTLTLPSTISDGQHTISVIAKDEKGNESRIDRSIVIRKAQAPTAAPKPNPSTTITNPVNNQSISKTTAPIVNLTGTVQDNGTDNIESAKFKITKSSGNPDNVNGVVSGKTITAAWTPTAVGQYTIELTVKLESNKTLTNTITVNITN